MRLVPSTEYLFMRSWRASGNDTRGATVLQGGSAQGAACRKAWLPLGHMYCRIQGRVICKKLQPFQKTLFKDFQAVQGNPKQLPVWIPFGVPTIEPVELLVPCRFLSLQRGMVPFGSQPGHPSPVPFRFRGGASAGGSDLQVEAGIWQRFPGTTKLFGAGIWLEPGRRFGCRHLGVLMGVLCPGALGRTDSMLVLLQRFCGAHRTS